MGVLLLLLPLVALLLVLQLRLVLRLLLLALLMFPEEKLLRWGSLAVPRRLLHARLLRLQV